MWLETLRAPKWILCVVPAVPNSAVRTHLELSVEETGTLVPMEVFSFFQAFWWWWSWCPRVESRDSRHPEAQWWEQVCGTEQVTGHGKAPQGCSWKQPVRGPESPNFSTSSDKELKMCSNKELSYVFDLCHPDTKWSFSIWERCLIFSILHLSTNISWSFNRKYPPSFPKFLPFFFFLVIKMFLVIHRIFQNTHGESIVLGTWIHSLFENSL